MASVGRIEKLYASYKNKAHIYVVYIREAHPVGGPRFVSKDFPIKDPATIEERRKVAREFVKDLKVTIPILVDNLDDKVGLAYSGWPDRVYVIDAKGTIALKGDIGPRGFTPAVIAAPDVLDKLLSSSPK